MSTPYDKLNQILEPCVNVTKDDPLLPILSNYNKYPISYTIYLQFDNSNQLVMTISTVDSKFKEALKTDVEGDKVVYDKILDYCKNKSEKKGEDDDIIVLESKHMLDIMDEDEMAAFVTTDEERFETWLEEHFKNDDDVMTYSKVMYDFAKKYNRLPVPRYDDRTNNFVFE